MNLDLLFAILFYGVLLIFFFKHRDRFEVQGKIFAMYKTRLGIGLMDKIAKTFPRTLRALAWLSIVTGFVGMGFIFYVLIKGTLELLFVPDAMPAVAPVLPGIRILPGLPVLSFWHWIVAIFLVAVVHEFSHGVYARLYNLKIKSSGFAFLGPILAAFVEPDERAMAKRSQKEQIVVFSAGPFSNVVMALVFLLLLNGVSGPVYGAVFENAGVVVNTALEGYPVAQAGIQTPFTIMNLSGVSTRDLSEFTNATRDLRPGQEVTLGTSKGVFTLELVENPENASRGFLGVSDFGVERVAKEAVVAKYGTFVPSVVSWVHMLIFWLWVVSFGIGLFNLLPLGPVDGGRMFFSAMMVVMRNRAAKAKKVWSLVSFFCLLLIFINLAPYLWKLLLWILKPFMLLFGI